MLWKPWKIVAVVFLLMAVLASGSSSMHAASKKAQIPVDYFYINACGSCDAEGEFRLMFDSLIGPVDDNVEIKLSMHNTFHHTDAVLLGEYYTEYQVPDDQQQVPILFINRTYLSGTDAIQSRLKSTFISEIQSHGSSPAIIPKTNGDVLNREYSTVKNPSNDSVLIYFYLPSCESCEKAAVSLDKLKDSYPVGEAQNRMTSNVVLKRFNAGEASCMRLLKGYFAAYKVPEEDQKVPVIFAGDTWFAGDESIEGRIQGFVASGSAIGTIELVSGDTIREPEGSPLSGYSALGVMAAGFVNGLNPCSLSIVLFLLSLLATKNIGILRAGIYFLAGKFIMFVLLGTLLYQVFLKADIDWFNLVTKIILVTLSVILIVLNIRDMIAARRENYGRIRLQLPEKVRKINHKMIRALAKLDCERVFLPMSVLIGALVAAGEFLCTGQIYLATIVMVLQSKSVLNSNAMIYFLLYGLAFIVPLLALTAIVHKGKALFEVSEAVRTKLPLIKLVNSAVFLLFSLAVIYGF